MASNAGVVCLSETMPFDYLRTLVMYPVKTRQTSSAVDLGEQQLINIKRSTSINTSARLITDCNYATTISRNPVTIRSVGNDCGFAAIRKREQKHANAIFGPARPSRKTTGKRKTF
ncbi:hypothetical protein E5D57_011804 [Metarhizium anisopliae]|nr:hypothetical protein E5D57_011804 [Metarhizium anisopliae]